MEPHERGCRPLSGESRNFRRLPPQPHALYFDKPSAPQRASGVAATRAFGSASYRRLCDEGTGYAGAVTYTRVYANSALP